MNARALVAEFIGTFAFIFIGAGAAAIGLGGVVGVAFAHGLVIFVFAAGYGHISGTHINPAVTIGLWTSKQIETVEAIGYIIVQLLGGIVGALALRFLAGGFGDVAANYYGATLLAPGINPIQGLIIETILTFFLVNTILNTVVSGRAGDAAPLAIGLTLTLSILMAGPLTGGSLNPARTLGPAIVSGNFSDIWLYFVGPILGGVIAALLYNGLLKFGK